MQTKRFVSEMPGVNGGYPVIAGTRIPIRSLLEYYALCEGDVQRIQDTVPYLNLSRCRPSRRRPWL